MICAGGDAVTTLRSVGEVRSIPTMRHGYRGGRFSVLATVTDNLPVMAQLLSEGQEFRSLVDDVRAFRPDLASCEAEPWGHRAAARLGVPRIGFDHYGVIVHCRPPRGSASWLAHRRDQVLYRTLMGEPDRVLVSSFYDAEPVRPGVRCVGALLRAEVRATAPSAGSHLLVYLNNGAHQFTPAVEACLHRTRMPAIIYGTPRTGTGGRP